MPDHTPDTAPQIPAAALAAAAEAATAVFDRALKLMAPPPVFVDEAIAAAAAALLTQLDYRESRLVDAADLAGVLNEPMLTRLRACAAGDNPSVIHPIEAAGLLQVIDKLTTIPERDPDSGEPASLADRHRHLRNALRDVVCTSGLDLPAEDRLLTMKDRAISALSADLP